MLNEDLTLPVTLKSVKSQTGVEIEHIIVDGGSTDNSLDIALKYADEASYSVTIVEQSNHGIYEAINQGLSLASGEIIAVLHANDYYASPFELESVVRKFDETHADIVYGNVRFESLISPKKITRRYSAALFSPEKLRDGFCPPHPATFIRMSVFQKYGFYATDYKLAADFEMMVRLLLRHRLTTAYLPREIVVMSPGGLSSHLTNRIWHNNREKLHALKSNGEKTSALSLMKRYLYLFKK